MYSVDKNQVSITGEIISSENFSFNLVCEKCKSTQVRFIPTSHYDDASDDVPSLLTLRMSCMNCDNAVELVMMDRRVSKPAPSIETEPPAFKEGDIVEVRRQYVGEITFVDDENQSADVLIEDYDGLEYTELSFPFSALRHM